MKLSECGRMGQALRLGQPRSNNYRRATPEKITGKNQGDNFFKTR
jgi:hypothetical protein